MRGFTLIETMLALAVGALLSSILYMCVSQSQRVSKAIDSLSSIQMRALIVQRQMYRDLSGICIPAYVLEPKKAQKDESSKKPQSGADKKEQPPTTAREEDTHAEKKKLLADAFNGAAQEGIFSQLRFVTNNPLEVYWSNKAGRPKVRAEKVTYVLEQEKTRRQPSYRLLRTMTYAEAGERKKEATQTHELATGIKKMDVVYTLVYEEQEENALKDKETAASPETQKKQGQEKKEASVVVKTFNEWQVEALDKDDIRMRKYVPSFITVTFELWDAFKDKAGTFTFTVPVEWQPSSVAQKVPRQPQPSERSAAGKQQSSPTPVAPQQKQRPMQR